MARHAYIVDWLRKGREATRKWYAGNLDRARELNRANRIANLEKACESARNWKRMNPEKTRAQCALYRAIKTGKLQRQPCEVCGSLDAQGHHDDYSKPLEVRWLCAVHHRMEHRKAA